MARMTSQQIDDFLMGSDHKGTMILAITRPDRGPLAVPLSFRWSHGVISFSTKRSRLHTKAFLAAGRATAMIHHERYEPGVQVERYVSIEGPVAIARGSSPDPDVFVEAILQPSSLVGVIYDLSDA